MNLHTIMNILELFVFYFLIGILGNLVLNKTIPELITWNKKRKRIKILKNMGFEERLLLISDENPTDEHVLLYYKMYVKKFELNTKEMWTTEQPMSYDDWEKYTIRNGGYKFMIPMTCDTMIGFRVDRKAKGC